jgi:rhomboid family GlyGly-CTERM serine protease
VNAPDRRWPWATAAIAALALVALAWPGAPAAWLLDRAAVQRGELWRLWTAHLVHFGTSHLAWNLAVFVAAGAWLERVAAARARIYFALAPAAIGTALLGFDPALDRYGGLSGLTAGAVALLAFVQLAACASRARGEPLGRDDRWFWIAVLVLLAAKIALEIFRERAVFARFESGDVHVVPLAHIAGVACAAVVFFTRRNRGAKPVRL